ncbi:MAG: hypothetical protein IPN23_10420 [Elusimicrobia bacterium]|nr:hypothetical protein [Elusimicrobiota bacterium]
MRKAADGGEIARTLAGEGFTHLLVNPAEMARVGQPAGFTAEEFQRAARFWAFYTEKLFEDGSAASAPPRWSLVYRLVPRRETPPPAPFPWVDWPFKRPGGRPQIRNPAIVSTT